MNSEERRSGRRELYRLRRERETTEEREERLARQREYMRHRRAGQTEQQRERNQQRRRQNIDILPVFLPSFSFITTKR